MKSWLAYMFSLALLTAILCLGLWLYQPLIWNFPHNLSFPVPFAFAIPTNNQVDTLDLWLPQPNIPDSQGSDVPEISATAALSYDLTNNQYLLVKHITKQLPMASLTKIMTAIIALEHPNVNDTYVVKQSDLVGNNSMGLTEGEVLSQHDLLYGLLLPSGNDAAETLASNSPFGRDGFIAAMNAKTSALGLSNTHFTNPTGLEGDGKQYTTAYDLLVISHFAMVHFPFFRDVVSTVEEDIPATDTHKEFDLFNEVNLLTSYPGVKGIKDGYTPEAGLCLVTYLDYKGHQIIAVILGSDDRRGEMKEILDYSLRKLGISPPAHG